MDKGFPVFFADWEDRFEFLMPYGSRLEVIFSPGLREEVPRPNGPWDGQRRSEKKMLVEVRRAGKVWGRREAEGLEKWFGLG